MNALIRVALVLVLIVIVIVAVRIVARWQAPPHPPLDLSGLGERPGVVVFTSTDCATCVEVMQTVSGVSAPVREVTWELEPQLFDRYHVEAVPLVAVLDEQGRSTLFETGNLHFISGDCEIADGISVEVSGGHTAAHQIVRIKDSMRNIIYPADICPTPLHLNPKRHEAFDLYPIETLQARNTLLRRAMRPDTLVAFSHAQDAVFYRIALQDNLYKAVATDEC